MSRVPAPSGEAILERHRRDWEELAELDPLWAIASVTENRYGRWDRDEFFATGRRLAEGFLARAAALGHPERQDRALDFGCGVGRITHGFADRFGEVVGLDISERMVARARSEHGDLPNCRFVVNHRPDLRVFSDSHFDLVFSDAVLQHVPTRDLVRGYLGEFVRVLRPGGLLACQVVTHMPAVLRVQHARRLYGALRAAGLKPDLLYNRFGLHPIRMTSLPEREATDVLERSGARILDSEVTAERPVRMTWFYATRDA